MNEPGKNIAEGEIDEFATGYVGAEVAVSNETEPDITDGLTAAVDEIAPKVDANGDAIAPPAAKLEEAPKAKVEIDADEYARLMSMPSTIERMQEEFTRKIDSAFGKIGSTEQMLRKIQEATPRGEVPKITREDLGEFGENYEYMSEDMLKVFNTVLAKAHGAGAPAGDFSSLVQQNLQDAMPTLRQQIRDQVTRGLQMDAVLEKHPDAEKLFGTKELLDFMSTLPEDEQKALNDPVIGWKAKTVLPFLDKFKAAKAPPAKVPDNVTSITRKAALKAAVNPQSSAGAPQAKGEVDEFLAGYNSGRE